MKFRRNEELLSAVLDWCTGKRRRQRGLVSSAVKRGSKVGGFVAWQPGLVPAVTTPSIDQFITHLTTVGYCAPQCVILMSRTVDPASLDRCSVCAWITYISMLSLLFNYRLIIRRLTGSIPTSVEYFSLF